MKNIIKHERRIASAARQAGGETRSVYPFVTYCQAMFYRAFFLGRGPTMTEMAMLAIARILSAARLLGCGLGI